MTRMLFCMFWLCLVGPAFAESRCAQDSLHLAMIPKKDIDRQITEYQPLITLLGQELSLPVRVFRATSYESVIDAVVSGGVDLAVLGPASYALAWARNPDIEAFASLTLHQGYFTPAGGYYQALLLVRSDSGIDGLSQTRGLRVALNDPASTSGALIPNREFPYAVGVGLARFFGAQVYTGSHDKSLDALLAGRVDAAFVSSARADEYLRRGLLDEHTLRVLWSSQPIHYDPFVFRAGLCEELKQPIRELLLNANPALSGFLASQQAAALTTVSHEDYLPLIQLLAEE